jgi:hypothetical protein
MTTRTVENWIITAPQRTFEAILSVTAERSRQEDKGWTPEHDDAAGWEHTAREAWARLPEAPTENSDPRATLVKCAALLVAAIEVLDRA